MPSAFVVPALYPPPSTLHPSRLQPLHHPRKGNDLADVRQTADPRDRALEAEPEAGVHERSVAAEVQIPVVGVEREPLFLYAPNELLVVVLALRPTNNLAIPLRRQA